MTKEIYISSTPHETRLAVVEDDQLAEIYYERENEYTLAGSVYKGKVTRVLPGMQSAFVDIGLERDAFLYVTDFAEEQEDGEEYVPLTQNQAQGNGHQNAPGRREAANNAQREPAASSPAEAGEDSDPGSRRWRGRRGRRRGRGGAQSARTAAPNADHADQQIAPSETGPSAIEFELEPIPGPFPSPSGFENEPSYEEERPRSSHREHSTEPSHPARPAQSQPAEPMVLPGESLSKYRRNQPPAARDRSSATQENSSAPATPAAHASSFQPATMVVAPLAWDGSDLLPGESISRYKKKASRSQSATKEQATFASPAAEAGATAQNDHAAATTSIDDAETQAAIPSAHAETAAPRSQDFQPAQEKHALREHPLTQHPIGLSTDVSSRPDPELAKEKVEAPAASENFDPAEGSASYRFDPSAPSAYRQSSVAEPPAETDAAAIAHEATPAGVEEPSGAIQANTPPDSAPEENPLPEPFFGESVSIAQPQHTPALESSSVAEETESQKETSSEEDDLADEHGIHAFDPGHGNLEEETIDEEETEADAAHALLDDEEYDDLVEETLDVQMDSGLLSEFVRDQHIDRRTRFQDDSAESSNGEGGAFQEEGETFVTESPGFELEEAEGDEEFAEDSEETDAANADSAPVRAGGQRNNRRGFRGQRQGQGANRGGRMRRSTAQMSNLPAITELLKPNQEILVQIAKEPIARKGARITSHIALPGRFLVFMPTVNHVGVSRKISSDEQRQRLKHILLSEKGSTSGGFIVRTAAASASEEDLRADIRFLLTLWAEIKQRADNSKPPALIYHDLSLVERVLRDQVTDNFSAIWVDSEADYERVLRFLNRFEPSLVRRVKLYTKETPLFEQFGIQEEINKALRSKVWLKSGGSIVINQTEALVAIDINTGKYVGKTARLEDTILKTNLDAIPEIVRQIRLRDLGGIIVIDFIDMDERKNRGKVMQALEDALKSDRAPSKVLQFNDFGLVAITRKRVKQSLERTLSVPCYVCTGTGMVKGPLTVCNEIYIELRKMHRQIDRADVLLRVHPEVVKQLKTANGRWLSEMEEMSGKTIIVKSDATLHPEQFDIH
ncbi:MAG: Rne/Rng family ribonuclease [Acidobacteriaceae bacterium]